LPGRFVDPLDLAAPGDSAVLPSAVNNSFDFEPHQAGCTYVFSGVYPFTVKQRIALERAGHSVDEVSDGGVIDREIKSSVLAGVPYPQFCAE
jgi:hypothetical protein